jgi:hypothetical protein
MPAEYCGETGGFPGDTKKEGNAVNQMLISLKYFSDFGGMLQFPHL